MQILCLVCENLPQAPGRQQVGGAEEGGAFIQSAVAGNASLRKASLNKRHERVEAKVGLVFVEKTNGRSVVSQKK